MLQQYDNELRGVLFRNDKKAENHPDYRGNAQINGVEYPISAWVRTSAKGVKFMSLSFTSPQQQPQQQQGGFQQQPAPQVPQVAAGAQFGDDLPFLWRPEDWDDVKATNWNPFD